MLRSDAPAISESADWDDADAAVYGGLQTAGVVVSDVREASPLRREYRLRCMSGEEGLLVIERPEPPSAPGAEPATMTVRCSIGRLGDQRAERRIVDQVAARLKALSGREFAPLPE